MFLSKSFLYLLCFKTYLTKNFLLSHEAKKYSHNCIVPHSTCFELPSSWCLYQFWSIFLANIKSHLHTHAQLKAPNNSPCIALKTFFIICFTRNQNLNIRWPNESINVHIKDEMSTKELGISSRILLGVKKQQRQEVRLE